MKSKMLFFNIAIILEDLKRYWGVAALYFLTLFFLGPLRIMSSFNNPETFPDYAIKDFLQYRDLQIVLSMIVPILLAMLIFRYLQQNKSTTLIHSFPITRGQLFHSHNIAGVLLLIIPVVLIAVILTIILSVNNDGSKLFQEMFTISTIFKWIWCSTISNIVVYFISALVAMNTGISIVQGILSFIFIFLPAGISFLMVINFEQLLYGFSINNRFFEKIVMKILPITTFMTREIIDTKFVLWYVTLSIILYFVAYYFYKKRPLESASDPIAFEIFKPIFKYGVTFCSMVLGGAYFYMMERVDSWLYIGYFIGAFLGYIIAEMIIKKSIWIFKNLKGFVIYSIVILIVFTGIKFDLTGYEKRIPNADDIQSVYYGDSLYGYWEDGEDSLKTLENINLVRELHAELIERKDEFINERESRFTRRIGIAYKLKNGRTLEREYTIPREFVNINDAIAKIYESKEYKMNYYGIFDLDINKINYINIDPQLKHGNEHVKIIELDEMIQMLNAMKADILDETYEEFISNKRRWADIVIYYDKEEKDLELKQNDLEYREKNDSMYIPWQKHHKHLAKWLKENGYYEKARVMPKDIDYVVIQKVSEDMKNDDGYHTLDIEKELKELKGNKDKERLEIKDKEKIEEILVNYGERSPEEKEYIVGIYYTSGGNELGWMNEKNTPKFVKNFFK